jgi:hypothetical protein
VVVLTRISVIGAVVPGANLAAPPVIFPGAPEIVGEGQENVEPGKSGVVVSTRLAVEPLQND